ncbi:DUF4302 domain-containing protein [Tenacibaculum sp. C7A-26P2]|uniref:DUF4302 domain-containing protein n=1 Tax=Tenacibaculum sp. C7A-26P2 TaxID=3447504 RepID=UPI003F861E31
MKLYIQKIIFIALTLLLFNACQDDDSGALFDQSATVRKTKKTEELRNILMSSENGWIARYFTDEEVLGGFTFFFKFTDEKMVEMASDFTSDLTSTISQYNISEGATVQLSFSTKGRIHELSDATNFPDAGLRGQGYLGAFEFSIYSIEEDKLVFRDVKNFKELIFEKVDSGIDWTTVLTANRDMLADNIIQNPLKSIYRDMILESEGETKIFSFNFNENRRYVQAVHITENGGEEKFDFGLSPTQNGFSIKPAIEYGGGVLSDFVYDAVTDEFIAESNGVKITLKYVNAPAILPDGYLELPSVLWFHQPAYNSPNFSPDYSSPAFINLLQGLNSANPFEIRQINFINLISDSGIFEVETDIGVIQVGFTKQIVDKKMILTQTGSNAPGILPFIQPLLDVVFDPSGLYVDQPAKLDNFVNLVFTFVPVSNTSIRYSAIKIR